MIVESEIKIAGHGSLSKCGMRLHDMEHQAITIFNRQKGVMVAVPLILPNAHQLLSPTLGPKPLQREKR